MARVTVEDCILRVPNRFELVMLAAHRARALSSGAELKVDRDRDKNPVVALREIAEMKLDLESLRESLIKSMRRHFEPEQPEEEIIQLMTEEQQDWAAGIDMNAEDADDGEGELSAEEEGELFTDVADMANYGSGFEDIDVSEENEK